MTAPDQGGMAILPSRQHRTETHQMWHLRRWFGEWERAVALNSRWWPPQGLILGRTHLPHLTSDQPHQTLTLLLHSPLPPQSRPGPKCLLVPLSLAPNLLLLLFRH